MTSQEFKKLIENYSKNLNLKRINTAYFTESEDSMVFLILRRSGFSAKYYLRLKTQIKPFEVNELEKKEFIKHDISEIFLSLDDDALELFNLENDMADNERSIKLENFFEREVKRWINLMLSKKSIIKEHKEGNLSLLPYVKSKLSIS